MFNNLEIAMITTTAIAAIAAIIMSIVNHRDAKKIREEHIDEFLERRQQRRKNRRSSL